LTAISSTARLLCPSVDHGPVIDSNAPTTSSFLAGSAGRAEAVPTAWLPIALPAITASARMMKWCLQRTAGFSFFLVVSS
jgi:hypothetical protein